MSADPRAAPLSLRLPRWQRRLVYAAFAAIVASGIGWLVAHYALVADGEFGAAEHPLAHWALVAHGIAAYLLLLLAGSLWPLHMRVAWRLRRNRWSGGGMATLLALLALSGLWLYYGAVDAREVVSVAHWAAGLGLAPLLALHIAAGRRARGIRR